MRVWLLTRSEKWEGDYPHQILSDEGLDRYLRDHPEFKLESNGESYSTYREGDYSWFDIVPWVLDKDVFPG